MATIVTGILLTAAPASAQKSDSSLPPTIASAGVTQAQWNAIRGEVRVQARRVNVSEAALPAALETARSALSGFEQVENTNGAAQARRLIADLESR